MQKTLKNSKGFTLIELIIVIVIIAILAAIAIPAVSKYVGDARMARVEADINTIRRCMEMALTETDWDDKTKFWYPLEYRPANTGGNNITDKDRALAKNIDTLTNESLKGKFGIYHDSDPSGGQTFILYRFESKDNYSTGTFDYMYNSDTGEITEPY